MALNITIDTLDFAAVEAKLREAGDRALVEIEATMAKTAEELKTTAEEIAHRHNPSIKVEAHVEPGVAIIEGASGDSPIAILEEGIKSRNREHWRHPVFGNDVWVEQKTHPYLKPALAMHRKHLRKDGEAALRRALETSGIPVGQAGS